jgi:hypothetical protein
VAVVSAAANIGAMLAPRWTSLWMGCGAACALACGSERLETAVNSTSDGSGGSAGSSAVLPGGAPAGAGGEPSPLQVEPLITLCDFGQGFMVGPIQAEQFQVGGQPFSDAWRATMTEPPANPWVAQLVMPLAKPVRAGQLLHLSFWMSCETAGDSGDCYTECIFERASEPWEKSVTFPAHGGSGWSQKSEYFSTVSDYGASQAHLVFRLGYATQVIALGGLELEAIGP